MHFWNSLPLFRLIIPFILGILLSDKIYFEGVLYVTVIVFLALFVVHKISFSYSFRWLFGALAFIFVFITGVWLNPNCLDFSDEQYFVNFLEEENTLFLELIEEPQAKANSFKVAAEVYAVNNKETKGTLLLYLEKKLDSLHYGNRLIALAKPREITNPSNPNQFNYRDFLFHKNISHQLYLSKSDIVILDEMGGSAFKKNILDFRQNLLNLFRKQDLSSQEISISSALLLGYKQDMSDEIKQVFSNTGVIHVLAVSGLHVGIIYLLLNVLLSFMDRTNILKLIKLLFVLLSLWAYAFLTAMSPSVMRASTMFSFLAIGSTLGRSTNIYNSLAASAFVLLLINPHFIYEVGFQLSYLAVLGIVMIYPKLYELYQFRFSFLDYFWQLLCISLAAQLITFPLSIYYFHQFPNYFFVANLFVVSLVPFIIYCGLGFLVFNEIAFLSEPFLYALRFLIKSTLEIVELIEQWPYSVSNFLYVNQLDVLIIYAIIGALLLAVYLRQKAWVNVSLLLLLTFQLLHILFQHQQQERKELIFYSINKHTAFGLVSNRCGLFFMNEELLADSSKLSFNLHNHWSFLSLNSREIIPLDSNLESHSVWKNGQHIQLANSRILLVNSDFTLFHINSPIEVDYCLISVNYSIKKIFSTYKVKYIVLDATLPRYIADRLSEECREMEIPFYNLNSQGALVVDLKH